MISIEEKFGKRLRQLREDMDLLQKDVGEAVQVSDRTIGNYESERREPDHNTLIRLADYFNVSIDYLLDRKNIPRNRIPDTKDIQNLFKSILKTKDLKVDNILLDKHDYEKLNTLFEAAVALIKK